MGENNNINLVCDTLDVTEILNKYLLNHGRENLETLLSEYIKRNLPEIINKHGLYGVAAMLSPETVDKEEFNKAFEQEDKNKTPNIDKNNIKEEKESASRFAESGIYEKDALHKVENDALTHVIPEVVEENSESNQINLNKNIENLYSEEKKTLDQIPNSSRYDEGITLPEINNNPWSDAQTVSPGETFKNRVLE